MLNHSDILLPVDSKTLEIARRLYKSVSQLPIISPHGHVNPAWFSLNKPFNDAAELFVIPDHYVLRMLISQGTHPKNLGMKYKKTSNDPERNRMIWREFCRGYDLFRGTPSRFWLDYAFGNLFDMTERPSINNADKLFDIIGDKLRKPEFRPRALFDRFNIEVLATTEDPLDQLNHHELIHNSEWSGRVIITYRPDNLTDPEYENFCTNVEKLGELTGCDTLNWKGFLEAHRIRRAYFRRFGATATDHGHPSARTENLSFNEASTLFSKTLTGKIDSMEAEVFRGQMLTEMAEMSVEDGMVMQLHPGAWRNHSPYIYSRYGRDKGFDIPKPTDYVNALKPLLNRFGHQKNFLLVLFTLDEASLSRELAPLAGAYPCLKLGPSWWFYDSPDGMRRFRKLTTETAGFYNTVGFNDDTRALCTIPARHDMTRRIDCGYLAELVASHVLQEEEAHQIAQDLTHGLAKKTYRL